MVNHIPYFLLLLLVFGCTSQEQNEAEVQPELVEKYFPNFPAQQFLDISLGESAQVVQEKLSGHQYQLKDEQQFHYLNEATHSEVILSEGSELNEFKLFLLDKKDIQNKGQIQQLFQEYADEINESSAFSTYVFKHSSVAFKTTLFVQKDLIRIVFQLKN